MIINIFFWFLNVSPFLFRISADKSGLNLNYLPYMRDQLTKPLIIKESDGVADVMKVMDTYCLVREDVDSIMEVTHWTGRKDPMSLINPKVLHLYKNEIIGNHAKLEVMCNLHFNW